MTANATILVGTVIAALTSLPTELYLQLVLLSEFTGWNNELILVQGILGGPIHVAFDQWLMHETHHLR